MSHLKTSDNNADLIIANGKIYTVALTIEEIKAGKTKFPIFDQGAIVVKDSKIITVCDAKDIYPYIGSKTKLVDVRGKTVIPGLIDSYIHAIWTGIGLQNVSLAHCKSLQDMQDALAKKAATVKPGEWIQGVKWNHLVWDKKELPTRYDLDKVCPNNPVYCVRHCSHIAVANSMALELANISKNTPNPKGGVFERDARGVPTGIIYEAGEMTIIANIIPEPNLEQMIRAIESAGTEFVKYGITSVIDANLPFNQMRAYKEAEKQGRLPFRANMLYYLDKEQGSIEDHLKRVGNLVVNGEFSDDMVRLSAVKIQLDCVPAIGPTYFGKTGKQVPEPCGFTTITQEELNTVACRAQENNLQLALHTVGNEAAECGLDAFEEAAKISDVRENRHYLIQNPWPSPENFARMRRMNVGVSIQPTIRHYQDDVSIHEDNQKNKNISYKKYFDEGIIVGGSSGSPIGNYNPFLSMSVAVNGECASGTVYNAEQRITPTQALIMFTKNSSFFSHDDKVLGSLEAGNYADIVVVDRDFINGPAEDIKNTKVEMTFLGGELFYLK